MLMIKIIFTIIFGIIIKVGKLPIYFQNGNILFNNNISLVTQIIMEMILGTISINVGLGIFNLIPLPPLDGSKVIKPFLPINARVWFENNEKIFEMIFVALWLMGILSRIISPVISMSVQGIFKLGFTIFKI